MFILIYSKTTFKKRVLLGLYQKIKWTCFVLYFATMQLMMYIGNDLIEAIPLENEKIAKPGYVGQFKRNLKTKYRELIRKYSNPPEFLVTRLLPQSSAGNIKQ